MFFNKKKRERTEADKSYAQARGETTTQVRFRQPACPVSRMLSTQNGERSIDTWEAVENALGELLTDGDQFVVLSVGEPRHDIFFVQTTPSNQGDGFILQVSIREGSGSRLVERICS